MAKKRKKTIEQVEVRGKRVLMRVDFNVPIDERGRITDDLRIRQALPTIQSAIKRGGKLILMSHLGRPEGTGYVESESLKPTADRLAELLPGVNVSFPDQDCTGAEAAKAIAAMEPGDIVVLENLRFHKGEKTGDPEFAKHLAGFGDIYVNDAFGTAHRNDGSMLAVPKAMAGKPRVIGLLMKKELEYLADAIEHARKPFVAVLGGAKVSDKLGAIRNLMGKVDAILVGGAMAYTFLKAQGQETGASRVEANRLSDARAILDSAGAGRTDLLLPRDHVCGREISRATPVEVHEGGIPEGWMGLDIGPKTMADYARMLRPAKTIVWNGPMGVFESPPFDVGTRQVAEAIVAATQAGAVSVVGGGDTAAAVETLGLADRVTHVSTGGGASLEMLEGKAFESLAVLDEGS